MANRWFRHALTMAAAGALIVPLGAATTAGATPAEHHSGPVVVVTGLNNPRQLSLVDGVELLIAEGGKGGTLGPVAGPEGPMFLGTTGSVSAVWFPQFAHNQSPHRIVTGLISGAGQDGSGATGSDGVSSRHLGDPVYVQLTAAPPGIFPADVEARQSGKLVRLRHGGVAPIADITGFERKHDPDGHGAEPEQSNPYAVLARSHDELVADAAGNDVLSVDKHGKIRVFHVFGNVTTGACAGQFDPTPAFPGCNFVPTSLATDQRGNVYVGGLSSLTPGQAQVVKLDPSGKHVLHRWLGFTSVTGLAVGRDGSLYVSQLFAPETSNPDGQGVVTKIDRYGHRKDVDVPLPAGLALDRYGNLFVSAFSIAPDTGLGIPGIDSSGQVWRLRI